jgi:phospholipase C
VLAAGALAVSGAVTATAASASTSGAGVAGFSRAAAGNGGSSTTTPIKHLVVIFQENVSFDHYFGTYPKAANTSGQPFHAAKGTPKVNNLADNPRCGGHRHPADEQPEPGRRRPPG